MKVATITILQVYILSVFAICTPSNAHNFEGQAAQDQIIRSIKCITNSIGIEMIDCADLPFLIGKKEVTQSQWLRIITNNPSFIKSPENPIESVTWFEAARFCVLLSQKEGKKYRLPTKAEWKLACESGTDTNVPIESVACCFPYSNGPQKGGSKTADINGVDDLYGNVNEWCLDSLSTWTNVLMICSTNAHEVSDHEQDSKFNRIAMGGSYLNSAKQCGFKAVREYKCGLGFVFSSDIGFRVICERTEPNTPTKAPVVPMKSKR